jgi:hypothetical protein
MPRFSLAISSGPVRLAAFALIAVAAALAQKVISAKAGLVYFVLGRVFIADGGTLGLGAVYRQLALGEVLFSEDGRAEVLLNPGTVLRIGEMTRIRMDNVELTDTRVSVEAGSAVVTVNDALKFDRVEIHIRDTIAAIDGPGVYRFDADRLRVFRGQAEVFREEQKIIVKSGREVRFPELSVGKFDRKDRDALQRWAELRGTPLPWSPLRSMACYSDPTNVEEAKDYIRDCLHLPVETK